MDGPCRPPENQDTELVYTPKWKRIVISLVNTTRVKSVFLGNICHKSRALNSLPTERVPRGLLEYRIRSSRIREMKA